jgi:hypothetical protein
MFDMKKFIAVFIVISFLCTFMVLGSEAKNRALLIGISDYSPQYNWNTISGTNDIDLIKGVLKGFSVKELRNENATYKNIIKEFERLIQQSKPADIVYIHFSGHGQPVEDYDGDEADGWDEAFVPYDAGEKYIQGVYEGDKHLIDDTLNGLLEQLRVKLGPSGALYVVMDACHAGEQFRGEEDDDEAPVRGSIMGISKNDKQFVAKLNTVKHYPITQEPAKSNIVMMEACRSYQVNREIKRDDKFYGPLSYSVYLVLKDMPIQSGGKWFLNVEEMFNKQRPAGSSQRMVIESTYE